MNEQNNHGLALREARRIAQLARLESIPMSEVARADFWQALRAEADRECPSGGDVATARRSICRALLQHGVRPAEESNLGLLLCQLVNTLNHYHPQ